MKALVAFLLSMTLSVPTQGIMRASNVFEQENIGVEYVLADESNTYSISESKPSTYNSYMKAYFRGLTRNFGYNTNDSCGYVAIGMLLAYYDSYLNDNIIPEIYDAESEGEGTNMPERDDSPGIHTEAPEYEELYLVDEGHEIEDAEYLDNMEEMAETHFQAKLFEIGKTLVKEDETFTVTTSYNEIKGVLKKYLDSLNNFNDESEGWKNDYFESPDIENDIFGYSVTSKTIANYSKRQIKKYIKEQIDLGNPVLVTVSDSSNKGHVLIFYDYDISQDEGMTYDEKIDEITFYAHPGWWKEKMAMVDTHYNVKKSKYANGIETALVLEFPNMEHSCSNNYAVGTGDDRKTYCYCSDEIGSYCTEWNQENAPQNHNGNLVVPDWLTRIDREAFSNNQNIISLTYEANSRLNSIGEQAFKGCSNLTHVEIPKSVVTIGNNSFSDTPKLEDVVFESGSNLQTICMQAFVGSGLMNISLPPSLKTLEPAVFLDTPRLTSIIVPNSVTYIGRSAVGGGDLLGNTNLTIYTDRTDIPSSGDGWQQNWNAIVDYSQSVPPSPGGYTKNSVFFGCTLSPDKSYVKSITRTSNNLLHPNANNIYNPPIREGYEFGGWYSNSSYMGTEYTTAEVAAQTSGTYYVKWIPYLRYNLLDDGTYEVGKIFDFLSDELIIPSTYDGVPVTKIADNGFENCTGITSVILPDTIEEIGFYAFSGCSNLTWVEMQYGIRLIKHYAFANSGLEDVVLPASVEAIGSFAFSNCASLGVVALLRTTEQFITQMYASSFMGSNNVCFVVFDEDSYYAYYEYFVALGAPNYAEWLQFIMYI